MEFRHKGYDIGLTITGQFVANVNGAEVVKKSLEAMKGFIDGNIKTGNAAKFTEFNAINLTSGNKTEVVRIAVIGVNKSRKSYGPRYFFTLGTMSRYGGEVAKIVPDTPENVAAMLAAEAYRQESDRIEAEREKVQHELNRKITWLTAVDHAAKIGVR